MKPWLSYSFDGPDGSLPEYTSRMSVYTPCYYWWHPSIYCEDVSRQEGVFYVDKPFPRANIKEIHVESVRAYHLLKRHTFVDDWEGLVRILPPKPADATPYPKMLNTVSFAFDYEELIISAKTTANLGGCSFMMPNALIEMGLQNAKLAIFPNKRMNTNSWLCAALAAGCLVVSSDAGSAEEYLSKYAEPGRWHVVHSHKQSAYEQAAAHLLGMKSDIDRSLYVDQAPYE